MQEIKEWLQTALNALRQTGQNAPISFTYAGKPSTALLGEWTLTEEPLPAQAGKRGTTITRTGPVTGLALRVEVSEYLDFPAVEWVAHFRNTSDKPTPILEAIHALDIRLPLEPGMALHYNRGDYNTPDSYEPLREAIVPGMALTVAPEGGRPTNKFMPYFNIACAESEQGVIASIGWPGQWSAEFKTDLAALHVTGGQELTHFTLLPGEEVRIPLVVLLFYAGSRVQGQNLWRKWMLAHNMPRGANGQPHAPMIPMCIGPWQEQGQKDNMDYLAAQGARYDAWWVDAGWYPCEGGDGPVSNPNWTHTGTWEPDPALLPQGFKPISEYAHQHGMRLIVWFEPERVWEGSWLDQTHPEWLLQAPTRQDEDWYKHNRLLNLGNAAARAWLTEHVDKMLCEQGIDWYRQDFNIDPLPFWRANDTPDRQGITEIKHVEGYLAYWDELRRRHPGILIDSCASGGRRNDIETLRRAVPLLRSDYQSFKGEASFAVGNQGHTYGLSAWIPYQGQGVYFSADQFVYCARSYLCASFAIALGIPKEQVDWALYNRTLAEFRAVQSCFFGDFYPLTPYSLEDHTWMAWQYDRPDLGEGMLQVFRHAGSPFTSAQLKLCGLEAGALYRVRDFDEAGEREYTGEVLMQQGLPVMLDAAPQARTLTYTRKG